MLCNCGCVACLSSPVDAFAVVVALLRADTSWCFVVSVSSLGGVVLRIGSHVLDRLVSLAG